MLSNIREISIGIIIIITLNNCNGNGPKIPYPSPVVPDLNINYFVPHYSPHDSSLFTEGLLFHDGQLYESTGSPDDLPRTRSLVGITDLNTGKFEKKIELDKVKYFGEGIVFLGNKLYQLTYKNQIGFIYDAKSFRKIGQFTYDNKEGWSLTTNGKDLIMSDGTSNITFLDSTNLKPIKLLHVSENGIPLENINELEYIKGFIYANIWMKDYVVKIDPNSGAVVGKLDLSALTKDAKAKNPKCDVLNGIAYDSINDKIYVTGKLWTNIYEISFPH